MSWCVRINIPKSTHFLFVWIEKDQEGLTSLHFDEEFTGSFVVVVFFVFVFLFVCFFKHILPQLSHTTDA